MLRVTKIWRERETEAQEMSRDISGPEDMRSQEQSFLSERNTNIN